MATSDSLIQVRNLKKHYHRGAIKALDGVTADINKGDVMVVIGPSGSGKSTFLRSLNLLEEPTDGEIIFNGVDITKKKYIDASGKKVKLDIDSLRQKMGMVFQHFNLFPHMTILDNMTLAPMKVKGVSKEAAEKKAAEDAAAQKAAQQKAAQQAASATQKTSNSSTTTTTTTSNTAANTTTSTTTTDSSDDTIDTSQGKYLGRFKLTAYCSCSICCGKWSGGGTASGTTPTPGRTIAMAGVPFGTKLSINGQIYTVEDRGTAYGHVDIFMGSHSQALSFGMKYADVYQVN